MLLCPARVCRRIIRHAYVAHACPKMATGGGGVRFGNCSGYVGQTRCKHRSVSQDAVSHGTSITGVQLSLHVEGRPTLDLLSVTERACGYTLAVTWYMLYVGAILCVVICDGQKLGLLTVMQRFKAKRYSTQ